MTPKRTFEKTLLRERNVKILPIVSGKYILCPECGEPFRSDLKGYEQYGKHAQRHPSLKYKNIEKIHFREKVK